MKLSPTKIPLWAGALHHVPTVLGAALATAIVTLALGVVYGTKLAQAPLEPYAVEHRGAHRYSTTYFVFYSATVPFLSTIHLIADLSLYLTARLRPLYALIGAVVFLCGWAGQVGFWTSCELPSGSELSGHECYQFYLQSDWNWGWKGIPLSLANTKAAFGYLCILLYITYLSFAAVAVHRQRKRAANGSERLGEEAYELGAGKGS